MTVQTPVENKLNSNRKPLVGGLILISLGVLFLAGQFLQVAWYGEFLMGVLAVGFLTAGLVTRHNGFLIPGGILAGLSLGRAAQVALVDTTLVHSGALFLVVFAAGWILISVLSLVNGRFMAWPLIPGAVFAVLGGGVWAGSLGIAALRLLGTYGWPLILIGIGIALLFRQRK